MAGTLQAHLEGSALLPLQMGFAARAAIQSVDLAAAGICGPSAWLTGTYGYLELYEGGEVDLEPLAALAGGDRAFRVRELSHKPFPSGRLTHGAIDALGRLQAEHGFAAGEVAQVRVVVPPLVERLVGRPPRNDMDAAYARLCLAYCAACRLLRGGVEVPEFAPAVLRDPALLDLARKVVIEVDQSFGPTAIVPQTIEVRLAGGRAYGSTIDRVLGSPDAQLDEAARLDKVRRCFDHARPARPSGAADRLILTVARLERTADVAELVA